MSVRLQKKRSLAALLLTAVFNTIIAVFLTLLGYGRSLETNLVVSQSIGLCICAFILAGYHLWNTSSRLRQVLMVICCILTGAGAGAVIGTWMSGSGAGDIFEPSLFLQLLMIALVFGTPITYFFVSREKMTQTAAELQQEKIKRLTLEKKTVEAHLRSLQAQIEPHFLFNTLSTILSLIDTDPPKSKRMLGDLTRYLRSSLSTIRRPSATLGEEIDLVQAYLDIHQIRMGDRLRCRIDVPAHLRNLPFPPMLLQPLVENAVKHGVEPKVDGGEIAVAVEDGGDRVRVSVTDTGCGLSNTAPTGVGLTSVRERLQAIYADTAGLILRANRPCGLKAVLEIPHERDQGRHR
jgi:sensor histidine kinase YesM